MNTYLLVMFWANAMSVAPTLMTHEQCRRVGAAFVEAGKSKWGGRAFECHAVDKG